MFQMKLHVTPLPTPSVVLTTDSSTGALTRKGYGKDIANPLGSQTTSVVRTARKVAMFFRYYKQLENHKCVLQQERSV